MLNPYDPKSNPNSKPGPDRRLSLNCNFNPNPKRSFDRIYTILGKDLAQHQVALFVRSTDIINLKEIEETIGQMNGPAAKVSNMISFGPKKPYGSNFRMVAQDYLVTPFDELNGGEGKIFGHHHITRNGLIDSRSDCSGSKLINFLIFSSPLIGCNPI